MTISIIAAVAANGVIGAGGKLPWNIPLDLQWFREKTLGKAVIMGRRTWESIGKPFDGRSVVVLSNDRDFRANGVLTAASLEAALLKARRAGSMLGEVMVAGGAMVYAQALPLADRIYLTEVNMKPTGDAFFPDFDRSFWDVTWSHRPPNAKRVEFKILQRNLREHDMPPPHPDL